MTNEILAHVVCQCGRKFQVLLSSEDLTDWDEHATADAYHAHLKTCGGDTK